MPHKKAKRNQRDQARDARGKDVAPSSLRLEKETIPKSVSRVLDAEKIRQDWNEKKRKRDAEGDGDKPTAATKKQKTATSKIKILPGESLGHFNRRVEDDMRSTLQSVRRAAKKVALPGRKSKVSSETKAEEAGDRISNDAAVKEFAPRATARRLNDVAQAPPNLSHDRFSVRSAAKIGQTGSFAAVDVVSPAHKRMMELEREKAIQRYRELKESRRTDAI